MSTIDETAKELKQAEADEELKDRLEREHGELLEELRALIPGSEVLFGSSSPSASPRRSNN
ncbi:MAG TPA: hypothetical protein VFB62_02720 [Polyangiaceae bacterium]|nr:hypothetical protein [Polyangiaceae bacterium]